MLCPRLELTTEFHYQKYLLFLHAVWTVRAISFDDELHVCMCLYTVCQYTLVRFPALRPCIWCRCLRLCAYKCDLEAFTVSATESTDKRQATITTTGGKLNLLLVHTKIIHTKRYYLDLYIPGIFNEIYVRTYIFIYFIWVSCHSIAKIRCAVFACECVCVYVSLRELMRMPLPLLLAWKSFFCFTRYDCWLISYIPHVYSMLHRSATHSIFK